MNFYNLRPYKISDQISNGRNKNGKTKKNLKINSEVHELRPEVNRTRLLALTLSRIAVGFRRGRSSVTKIATENREIHLNVKVANKNRAGSNSDVKTTNNNHARQQ